MLLISLVRCLEKALRSAAAVQHQRIRVSLSSWAGRLHVYICIYDFLASCYIYIYGFVADDVDELTTATLVIVVLYPRVDATATVDCNIGVGSPKFLTR